MHYRELVSAGNFRWSGLTHPGGDFFVVWEVDKADISAAYVQWQPLQRRQIPLGPRDPQQPKYIWNASTTRCKKCKPGVDKGEF